MNAIDTELFCLSDIYLYKIPYFNTYTFYTMECMDFMERKRAGRYVFGLARCGSTIGFHLPWHTVELAMSTRLCLL